MKYKIACIILLGSIMHFSSFAQVTITNQKTIGGDNLDYSYCSDVTKDGGLIAGGYSLSGISGEKTDTGRGNYDYWVVKLNSHGKIQWDKTIGGNSTDELYAVKQTSDGGYILGGYSLSKKSGEKSQTGSGGYDYWVVKLDSMGVIQWDKTIGGSSYEELHSVDQTTDGGYILGGYSQSNISGDKTENSRGGNDYWVVKLNSSGKIQWDKTIGGNKYDGLSAIQQTADKGYIIGGSSTSDSSGEKTGNSRGDYDYWVVKLDSSGNIQWDKTIGGTDFDALNTLTQTNDGGYMLGGYSQSDISGEKTENGKGHTDFWVVKLDNAGNIQWDKTFGGRAVDILYSLQQTSDNGYILGGHSHSNISGDKTEISRGNDDYWVVKLDNAGNIQWDKTIGGAGNDYLKSIKEIKKNYYALAGFSFSKKSGEKSQPRRGGCDYWIVYLKYKKPPVNLPEKLYSFSSKQSIDFIK